MPAEHDQYAVFRNRIHLRLALNLRRLVLLPNRLHEKNHMPPIYLHLIFAILQFEILSLMDFFFYFELDFSACCTLCVDLRSE